MTAAETPHPSFSWRRELPLLILVVAVALLSRWPATPYAEFHWNSDGAITCLMAKHLWEGERPIFFYGQVYNGNLEPLFAAPFYGRYGASLEGFAVSRVLLMAIVALALYRLCWEVGGRGGALAGSLAYALGTMPLMVNLAQEQSYILLCLFGVLLVLSGTKLIRQPTPGRCFGVGLVAGLAWFNNPQIVTFIVPLIVLLYLRGRTCALRGEGRLLEALGPQRTRVVLWFGALVVWIALSLGLALAGGIEWRGLSLTSPDKYLQRGIGLLGLSLAALEFRLATDRRLLVKLLAIFAAGFLIGDAPHIYFHARNKLRGIEVPRGTPTGIDPTYIRRHFERDLALHGGRTLFNYPEVEGPIKGKHAWLTDPLYRGWRYTVIGIAALAALGLLVIERRALWRMVRLRPVEPTLGLLLGLQAVALLMLFLCYPRDDLYLRYLQAWWVPYSALVAGTWAVLRRRGAALAWGAVAVWVGFFALCAVHNNLSIRAWHRIEKGDWRDLRKVIAAVERRDYHHGYANFWMGYRMTYLSDERIIFRPWPEDQPELYQRYIEAIDRARKVVWAFYRSDNEKTDPKMLELFNAAYRGKVFLVEHEERVGPWLLVFCKRPGG